MATDQINSTVYTFVSGMNILYINYCYASTDIYQEAVNNFNQAQAESVINIAIIDITNVYEYEDLVNSYIKNEDLGFNIMLYDANGSVFLTKAKYLTKFSIYYQIPYTVVDCRSL